MNFIKKYSEQLILIAIILLAAVLRFYHYSDWSLSNDELSAITRLNFSSFDQLIKEGVRPDYHPAGVEVFLFYWIKIFSNAVWSVRLPFVLCGIASVYYTYHIAKKWFSVSTAQFSALTLACLTYPILYSQLARPYSPGLLFSLMMVYYWSKLLFDKNSKIKYVIGYTLSTALCMYTHYFSFLFAVIVGLSGLFYLNSSNYKKYLTAGIFSVILFLPHLSISMEQLSRGGVGSWLGKPNSDFFYDYLLYAFNDSKIIIGIMSAVFFISAITGLLSQQRNKFRILSLLWFLIPFLIGYYYSIYINPVLQFSILLFSFPFILFFLFSYINTIPVALRNILFTVIGILIIWTGVHGQKFYSQKPFSSFKELTENDNEWCAKYGKDNIQSLYNVISPSYLEYYFSGNENDDKDKIYSSRSYFHGGDSNAFVKTAETVAQCDKPYFIYGWSNNDCPPEIYELIKSRYPKVLEDYVYFNSRVTIFSKDLTFKRKLLFSTSLDLASTPKYGWKYDQTRVDTFLNYRKYRINDGDEYSPGFEGRLNGLTNDSITYLNISAQIYSLFPATPNVNLVIEFHRKDNDSLYDWHAALGKKSLIKSNMSWDSLFLTQKIPVSYHKGDKIKVYVWNPDKKFLWLCNIRINSFQDMDYEPKYNYK